MEEKMRHKQRHFVCAFLIGMFMFLYCFMPSLKARSSQPAYTHAHILQKNIIARYRVLLYTLEHIRDGMNLKKKAYSQGDLESIKILTECQVDHKQLFSHQLSIQDVSKGLANIQKQIEKIKTIRERPQQHARQRPLLQSGLNERVDRVFRLADELQKKLTLFERLQTGSDNDDVLPFFHPASPLHRQNSPHRQPFRTDFETLNQPGNDDCNNAFPAGNGTYTGTLYNATIDGSGCIHGYDVWYLYTAPSDGDILMWVYGGSGNIYIAVYDATQGCPGNESSLIACGERGYFSQVLLSVVQGKQYLIRIIVEDASTPTEYRLYIGPPASISGTVVDARSRLPLENASIWLFLPYEFVSYVANTDSTGSFIIKNLPPNYYHMITSHPTHVSEMYYDIPLYQSSNSYAQGDLVRVQSGQNLAGFFIDLERKGIIRGRVIDEVTGEPLQSVQIDVYDHNWNYITSTWTDTQGRFEVTDIEFMDPGAYFLSTWNDQGYIDETYDGSLCTFWGYCEKDHIRPVYYEPAKDVEHVDFALNQGGTITGRLIEERTGIPVEGYVEVLNAKWEVVMMGSAGPDGTFELWGPIPPGRYYLTGKGCDFCMRTLYDKIPCTGKCDVVQGSGVLVTNNSITDIGDFVLLRGGKFEGQVFNAETGSPIKASIDIYDWKGDLVCPTTTNSSGAYTSCGLQPGQYYAIAEAYFLPDHTRVIYNDKPCPLWSCDFSTATPILVQKEQVTPGIDFHVPRGGSITGTITDSASGQVIESSTIAIFDNQGNYIGDVYVSGDYVVDRLPSGQYFVVAYDMPEHIGELYDNIQCFDLQCDVTTGTPVSVTLGQTTSGINFALDRGGSIQGDIYNESTGMKLLWHRIQVFDANGTWVSEGVYRKDGYHLFRLLPTGQYYVTTWGITNLIDELYDDIPCPRGSCDLTTGTPVQVVEGQQTSGIDFYLRRGGTIQGKVTQEKTGKPLKGVHIEIYDASGRKYADLETDRDGQFASYSGFPPGVYYVKTSNTLGFMDEIYEDIPCLPNSCDLTTGKPIVITSSRDYYDIHIRLHTALRPNQFVIDDSNGGNGNGILEVGEIASIQPAWINVTGSPLQNVSGVITTFETVQIFDDTAFYGNIAMGEEKSCAVTGDCYVIGVDGPRNPFHRDIRMTEVLSGGESIDWQVHLGESFADVPVTSPIYPYVETILHHRVMTGCGQGNYCPKEEITRGSMAVYLANLLTNGTVPSYLTVSATGRAYDCEDGLGNPFVDVPDTHPACAHIHYLWAHGYIRGCAIDTYCPQQRVTRGQMAIYIVSALLDGNVPPISYIDPSTGRFYDCSDNAENHFTDVNDGHPTCPYVHYLWARGYIEGCQAHMYCPTSDVTRGQMAVYLSRSFELSLNDFSP